MTLSDLAALAAKVEGFERLTKPHEICGGTGMVGTLALSPCSCQFAGWAPALGRDWDDSPAALAMAVQQHVTKYALCSELDDERIVVHAHRRTGTCGLPDASAESIARALLVALLRAHGVEVADDPR